MRRKTDDILAIQDRCRGLLLGMAAGDRSGRPIQMAVRLAESLVDNLAIQNRRRTSTNIIGGKRTMNITPRHDDDERKPFR